MTKSNNLGKSIYFIIVVFLFGCGGEDLSSIEPDHTFIFAHNALMEYNDNKVAFAENYENKVLQIYGHVLGIREGNISIYAGTDEGLDSFIGGIECRFSKHQNQINDLSKKNLVWIKGRFSKEEKVDGFILEDCYIGESNSETARHDNMGRMDNPYNKNQEEDESRNMTDLGVYEDDMEAMARLDEMMSKYPGDYSVLSFNEVTDEYLEGRSKSELRLMRNEIFARHGYIFKSKDLREHFSVQPWYEPRFDNVPDKLSEIEKANIALIKRYEK